MNEKLQILLVKGTQLTFETNKHERTAYIFTGLIMSSI